jgi:hypothetical protein
MAKKLPKEVKVVQEYKARKIDYNTEKNISYSQFSIYDTCKYRWYLSYPKKLAPYKPSIHTVFGTALHETVQEWLDVLYNQTVKAANEMDLSELLLDRMRKTYKKERYNNGNEDFTTPQELQSFHSDGVEILNYLKKKRAVYFSTKNTYLAGVETPIFQEMKPGVIFKGFIDLVFYNTFTEKYLILDIKTSTKGWSDYEKKDDTKIAQILLYKDFFAQQFNVDVESIDVEYFIVRRKIYEGGEFVPKRVQEFKPASGKIKRGKAMNAIKAFVEDAFDDTGNYQDKEYPKEPSKNACRFCPFNQNPLCNVAVK